MSRLRRRWYCWECGRLNHAKRIKCIKCGGEAEAIGAPEEYAEFCSGVILEGAAYVFRLPMRPDNPVVLPTTRALKPRPCDCNAGLPSLAPSPEEVSGE